MKTFDQMVDFLFKAATVKSPVEKDVREMSPETVKDFVENLGGALGKFAVDHQKDPAAFFGELSIEIGNSIEFHKGLKLADAAIKAAIEPEDKAFCSLCPEENCPDRSAAFARAGVTVAVTQG